MPFFKSESPRTKGQLKANHPAAPPKMEVAKGVVKTAVSKSLKAIKKRDTKQTDKHTDKKPLMSVDKNEKNIDIVSVNQSPGKLDVEGLPERDRGMPVELTPEFQNRANKEPRRSSFTEILISIKKSHSQRPVMMRSFSVRPQGAVTFWATGPAKGNKCLVEEEDGTRRLVSLYTEDGSRLIEGEVYRVRKET